MALLKFLKGNYTSLSTKAIAEGQILICGDTGEMFVDVAADKRVKIGDFSVVANIAALEALDASAVPTSRLYYVEDGNILARSNGTSWIQINKQKTLAELGGVSKDTYDTKMTALDKADTDNANAIAGVDTRLQAAEEKLKSVATTQGLSDLTKTVEGHTASIDTIMGGAEVTGSMENIAKAAADAKDEAIQAAKDAADAAQADVDELAQTHATDKKNLEDAIALKADADNVYTKGEIDSKVDAIDDAIADKANADDVYTQDEIDGMISTLEGADEAIHNLIGDVDVGKTVVEMIAAAEEAATYDDTAIKALIDANADAIEQEVSDREGAVSGLKTELEGKIADVETSVATEKSRAEGIEEGLRTDVDAIKADYLKAADKEDLQAQINTIMNNPDTEGVINSINEFTQYIADHGEIAEGFRADIDANAKAIEDHEALAAQTYETKEDATAKFDEVKAEIAAKAVQADWNQNDESAADFVKNRTHYASSRYVNESREIVRTGPMGASGEVDADFAKLLYENRKIAKYMVTGNPNDPAIECVYDSEHESYTSGERCAFIIKSVTDDNGYSVLVSDGGDVGYINVADHGATMTHSAVTFIVEGQIEEVVKLDEKFIPDTIARVSEVESVADGLIHAWGNITNLQTAIDNLGALAAKDVVSESDLDAELTTKVNAYADVQSALDTHINRTDIHVTTEDKAKWDGAQAAAEATAAAALATAREEITAEIATAKGEAVADAKAETESQVAVEAARADAAEKANAKAIADEKTAREQADAGLQAAIDTINDETNGILAQAKADATSKANTAESNAKSYIEGLLTWGEF